MRKTRILQPYLFISASVALLGLVYFYPIIRMIRDSFYRFSGGEVIFVKFENYLYLLTRDIGARTALFNNLKLLLSIPVLLVLSIFFAVIFYEGVRGGKIYQTIIFIPKVLSIVVVGLIFSYLLRTNGLVNNIFKTLNLDFLALDWLGDANIAIYTIILIIVWKELGFGILLFSARLASLDESIIDASKVDGANWLQRLIYITTPQLKGLISFFVVYKIMINFAWIFAYVYVLTGGGPANKTTVIELEIYSFAFLKNLRGIASALSVLLLFGIMIFIFLQHYLRKEMEE